MIGDGLGNAMFRTIARALEYIPDLLHIHDYVFSSN